MSIRKLEVDVDREKKVESLRSQICQIRNQGQGHPYHNLKQSVQIYFLYWLLQVSICMYTHVCHVDLLCYIHEFHLLCTVQSEQCAKCNVQCTLRP